VILASRPPINEIVERSVTMIWFEVDAIGVDCLINFALKSGTIIFNGDAAAKTPRICSWLFPRRVGSICTSLPVAEIRTDGDSWSR